jgi:hypothetical protein
VYVKGANLGFGLKEMPYRIVHLLALFALIFLGIRSIVPEAQSQTRSDFPDETSTISSTKPRCFFRIGTALSLIDNQIRENRKSLPTLFHPPTRSGNGGSVRRGGALLTMEWKQGSMVAQDRRDIRVALLLPRTTSQIRVFCAGLVQRQTIMLFRIPAVMMREDAYGCAQ